MTINRKIPARRPQTTFRADADFLRRVDERAMLETAQLGVDVSMSDLIRRGLQMVLDTPPPRGPRPERYDCLAVPMANGGMRCLTCRSETPLGSSKLECLKHG